MLKNTDSIKAEIERILKVLDDAYAQNNEGEMESTYVDSLMYINDSQRIHVPKVK